jgi:hypothetical protein
MDNADKRPQIPHMLQTVMVHTRRFRLPLAALLLLLAMPRAHAAGGEAAQPANAATLSVAMTLYIQGLTLGTVAIEAAYAPDSYQAVSRLKTEGIITLLWKQTIQATVSGRIRKDGFRPQLYDAFVIKSDGSNEQISLTYPENGPPRLSVDPPFMDSVKIEVPVRDQAESLDPVSALVTMLAGFGGGAPAARR